MAVFAKEEARQRRKIRISKKVTGSAERPRFFVYRSNAHIYASIVDDESGATIVSMSTLQLSKSGTRVGCNKEGASLVGKEIARLAKEKNVCRVVFDRNGYIYHGRIQAVAEGARESGLEF